VKINPVPLVYQFVGGWVRIQAKVNLWALAQGYPTYDDYPVGFWPPRLACNVKYFPATGSMIDAGRFVA
jgi:hypothetical protein